MPSIRIHVQGQSFDAPLPATAVHIGSGPEADLRIEVEGIALEHCTLEPLGADRFKLRDAGSGLPTKVNGIAIKQVSLRDGDRIDVGPASITYSAGGAPAQAAQPARPARPAVPAEAARPAKPVVAQAAGSVGVDEAPAEPLLASQAQESGGSSTTRPVASGQAEAEAAPQRRRGGERPASKSKSRLLMLGLLVALGALGVVGLAVLGPDGGAGHEAAQELYAQGRRLYEAKDYEGAREAWSRLAGDTSAGVLRGRAEDGLRLVGEAQREMQGRLERVWSERLDMTADALAFERARFLESYGDGRAPLFDETAERARAAQAAWRREALADAEEEVADLTRLSRYAEAREVWKTVGRAAPAAVDVVGDVDAQLRTLEAQADARAAEVAERVRAWNKAGLTFRSKSLLQDMLPRFAGLAAHATLQKAWEETLVEHAKPVVIEPTRPEPGDPSGSQPTRPLPPQPPVDEEARAALAQRAESLSRRVDEIVHGRRFAEGAQALRKELATFPASELRTQLEGRARDLELAEEGLERLIAHINANPDRYQGVRIAPRLSVSLIDADRETLGARITGGTSRHHWARLAVGAFEKLLARMRPERTGAVPAAALLHAVGSMEAAERALYEASQKGVPTAELFPRLARWRAQAIPDGGYVAHEGRFVTPREREVLIREARIAAALARLAARDVNERKAAYEDLLALGEPAAERFGQALRRRRAYLADALVRSKSFTGGKYKAKLLQLLDQRRKHALALIYDANAYPYPNPQKKNQKEVEERVDAVREVWERPFDLVAQWDKKLKERLQGVTEVDEVLSRLEVGYRPDLDEIKQRINAAIDVPGAADPSTRPYSLQVMAYNTTLATTATGQEKANVRSVNEYRTMMGLVAVKIDEKLTRAARGHSRHMATHNYFAHNVPAPYATPTNRSPGVRAKQQGFGGGVGENIARGPGTGHGAFLAWFGSSGHHRNMLGRSWMVMGCGRANGSWWTQLFGGGSKSLKAPDPLPPPAPEVAPDKEDDGGRAQARGPIEVPDEVPPGDPQPPDDGSDGEDDAPGR